MPIYEYECEKCELIHEEFVLSSKEVTDHINCPCCNGVARKILSRCFIAVCPDATDSELGYYQRLHKYVADNKEKFDSGEMELTGNPKHKSLAI